MYVHEVMSADPVTLAPADKLSEAWTILAEEGIRHLPVVQDGELRGVVSDRDLLEATGGDAGRGGDRELGEVMCRTVKTVEPDDTLVTASLELGTRGIGCLPVVRESGELVAIVTETDILRAYLEGRSDGRFTAEDPNVARHMTAVPEAVSPDTSLSDALDLVATRGFRHVPVVNGEELVGILSHRDLCRELGRGDLERPVSDAMATRVVGVAPSDSLAQAAGLLLENKISALPVLEYGALVGILTITDLVDHCLVTLGEG